MLIELDIWRLFGFGGGLLAAFWVLVKVIVSQFNTGLTVRFEQLEKARSEATVRDNERFLRIEEGQKQLERDQLQMKAELPDKYVKREDAIRSEVTLHAKFDGLANNIHEYFRRNNND